MRFLPHLVIEQADASSGIKRLPQPITIALPLEKRALMCKSTAHKSFLNRLINNKVQG